MVPHPLTTLMIEKYFSNKPKFKGMYSQNNFPNTMKDVEYYIVNVNEHKSNRYLLDSFVWEW